MIYEYKCDACGRKMDKHRKIDERNDPLLCQCGESMRRVVSAPNFKFKAKREDVNKTTRRLLNLKRGEKVYEDPYTGGTVHLSDNKEVAKAQVIQEIQKGRPHVKKKDIEVNL